MDVDIIIMLYWMWRKIAYSTRSIWCREIFEDRNSYGHGAKLLPTLRNKDAYHFRNFTRMTVSTYSEFYLSLSFCFIITLVNSLKNVLTWE